LFCDALDRLGPEALRKITVTFVDNAAALTGQKSGQFLHERSRKWAFTWQVAAMGFADLYQHLQGEGRLAVLPSPMENSPLAVRQCLTLGLPFVAIQCPGVPN